MSIVNKLIAHSKSNIYPFHMPGHKRRIYPAAPLKSFYEMDITEIDGFDNLHDATGIIRASEKRAAQIFGADNTYFLVNGTTSGMLAAICGTVTSGDAIVVARNCHRCVYNAVMLSGAQPYYVYPERESYCDINAGISAEQIEKMLCNITDAKGMAVVITSPTYEGVISDIEAISQVCHKYGAVLIVDAAHGAHLELSDDFPIGAIASGADIVVTSIHKTLPAPTQTSLIHIADGVQGAERVRQMLTVFQSSSPSYPLMAGIDAMMELIENRGQALFSKYVSRLNDIYKYAEDFNNLTLLTRDKLTSEYSKDFDFGKLVVYDRSGKITGRALYDTLLNNYKLQPEMAAGGYVVLMTSIADDEQGFNRLKKALSEIDASLSGEEDINLDKKRSFLGKVIDRLTGRKIKKVLFGNGNNPYEYDFNKVVSLVEAESVSNIKTAVFENSESIPVELSEGRISAGFIMLYPPGIPIVVPGERLSGEMVDSILESRKLGLTINGLMDSGEIKVLWE